MLSSDLRGIYYIVLQGKFQPSGTPGKFKEMLRCTVFAIIIWPRSTATHYFIPFPVHYNKKRASDYTSDAQSAVELDCCHLKVKRTSLLGHRTHHHTLQQWQMYSIVR